MREGSVLRRAVMAGVIGVASCMTLAIARAESPAAQRDAAHARPETAADHQISERVRHALADDDSFSTRAKNVSVVTLDGVVTLRGAVPNEQERNAIAAKVRGIAGVVALDDQLEASAR